MKFVIPAVLACAVTVTAMTFPYNGYRPGYGGGIPTPGVVVPGVGGGLPMLPGVNPVPIVPGQAMMPGYGGNRGNSYIDQGYQQGGGANSGGGYQNQGSNLFYDQGQKHSRTKSIMETENSSTRNLGGNNQGSSMGQSGSGYQNYGGGHLNAGNGYQQGYGMY